MTERFIELESMQCTRRCFYQFRSNLHASGKSVVSFDELDLDGDGIIDRSEFRAAKPRAGVRLQFKCCLLYCVCYAHSFAAYSPSSSYSSVCHCGSPTDRNQVNSWSIVVLTCMGHGNQCLAISSVCHCGCLVAHSLCAFCCASRTLQDYHTVVTSLHTVLSLFFFQSFGYQFLYQYPYWWWAR